MQTVLALYERMEDARAAHDALQREHLGNVDIVCPDDRPRRLGTFGIPSETEPLYLDAIRSGLVMVVTQLADERTTIAKEVLRRHHPVDLERWMAERAQDVRTERDDDARAMWHGLGPMR